MVGRLSHVITKCPEPELNQRHEDFQSSALPTELSGQGQFRALEKDRFLFPVTKIIQLW